MLLTPRDKDGREVLRPRWVLQSVAACTGLFLRVACTAALLLSLGCSEFSARNVSSLLFDGVPALPEPDTYCAPWLAARQAPLSSSRTGKTVPAKPQGSTHLPYVEKQCNDCHDKSKDKGLVAPPEKLCFICHDTIVTGAFVHAPAGSGNCLACHVPHDSVLPRLLAKEDGKLCLHCHQEARMSTRVHEKSNELKIPCYDCHDPHAGSNRYFFK
jgi:predicted CXXCH cytochrome family protein